MKIPNITVNNIKFGDKYKTADVLRFVLDYDFHNRNTDPEFFKSLTGMELFSSSIYKELADKYSNFLAYVGIHDASSEEILKQCPKLQSAVDTFDASLHLKKSRAAQNEWLDIQIKKLGKFVDLTPFKPNEDKIRQSSKEMDEFIKNLRI